MAKIIGNTTVTPMAVPDWKQDNETRADYIKNKPTLGTLAVKDKVAKDDLTQEVQEMLGQSGSAELAEKVATLEQQMANLLYTAIYVTSFSNNAGTKEYGSTVSSVTLSWAINKTPTALTLDGETLDVSVRSKALTGLSITKDNKKTWKLVATDERGATSTKTTTISFANGIYYGAKAAPSSYNSAFVLGLKKELRNDIKSSFSVSSGAGQYIYYCQPTRLGKCAFTLGGFNGGFILADTITFTNQSGYSEPYYIYRSDNANLGSPLVTVKGGG